MPSGAPPDTNVRTWPPNASRILLYTNLFASDQPNPLGVRPAKVSCRCVFPVARAHIKILLFTGDAADFPSTASRIFTYTRGTPTKIVGCTAFIAAGRRSNFAQYASRVPWHINA